LNLGEVMRGDRIQNSDYKVSITTFSLGHLHFSNLTFNSSFLGRILSARFWELLLSERWRYKCSESS
jgi:hypothetical protein